MDVICRFFVLFCEWRFCLSIMEIRLIRNNFWCLTLVYFGQMAAPSMKCPSEGKNARIEICLCFGMRPYFAETRECNLFAGLTASFTGLFDSQRKR